MQDEAKAGPIRRKIKAIQAEEKELQEKHYQLAQKTPHFEQDVNHAEEKRQFAEDQVRNAKKRVEKLEKKFHGLDGDHGAMLGRRERLEKWSTQGLPSAFLRTPSLAPQKGRIPKRRILLRRWPISRISPSALVLSIVSKVHPTRSLGQ